MSGATSPVQADAIDFTGGANSLDLSAGTLSGNIGVDGTGTTLDFVQSSAAALANVITGTGAVIDSGSGTLTLSGANTYTGGTSLDSGTLVADYLANGTHDDALGSGSVTLNGGTLSGGGLLGNAVIVGSLGGTLNLDTGVYPGFNIAGGITGSGALTFTGDNIFLSGDDSGFSGTTILQAGALVQAESGNAFSASSAFQVASGATLDLYAQSETIASLADLNGSGGTVTSSLTGLANPVILTLDGSGTTSFSGTIEAGQGHPLKLIKSGTGIQTLSGVNTYSGGTTLSGGTLELGQQSSAGTGAITFGAGAAETLQIDVVGGTLGASVAGFAANDVIDFKALNATDATTSYNGTTLTVTSGTTTEAIAINPAPSGEEYVVSADTAHGGGTDVTLAAIPAPVITAPTNGTDTNNPEPTISGTGESGDTVTLTASSNGTTFTAGATVTNGMWSITPQGALPDGTYTATATESSPNGTGVSGTSNTDTFTIDTTAPTVAITSQGGAINQAAQTITGTVDVADVGTIVSLFDNGGTTAVGTGQVQANGDFTIPVNLAQGSNALVAKDTDSGGNTGISKTVTYTLDTTAPTITAVSDSGPGIDTNGNGDLGAGKTVTVTVTTSEPIYVTPGPNGATPTATLNDNGVATYVGGSGTNQLTFTYTVAGGQNTAKLSVASLNANGAAVTDAAGNPINPSLASATVPSGALMIDTTPPAVSSPTLTVAQNAGATPIGIAAPTDNPTPTSGLAIVAGSLPSDGTVTLADGTTPVTAGETLTNAQLTSLEFTPTPGVFSQGSTFTFTATDGAGNSSTGTAALDIGGSGAPTITGTHASSTSAEAAVMPFTGVTLADPSQATETLAIALRNGGGTLAGTGLVANTDGSYTLSGSAATVTQQLDALSFTPSAPAPGTSATTTFVLSDASSAGTAVSDAGTSVTDIAAATSAPTPAPDTVSIDPDPAFLGRGTFLLTGTASSPAGVRSVEISAKVDGVETDLGAATLDPDGTFAFADHVGANVQGFITATATDNAGGTTSNSPLLSLEAGLGSSYVARENHYSPDDNTHTGSTLYRRDGKSTEVIRSPGQTVTSSPYAIFDNNRATDTTFVFDPGFGIDVVKGFRVGGSGHDVIDLPSSDFTNIADVLRNTGDIQGSAWITDPKTGDAIRLAGVTTAELKAHPKDIAFHG